MRYLVFFLLLSNFAFGDLAEDVVTQAIRERWTFDFHIPIAFHAKGFVRKQKMRSHLAFAAVAPATNLPTHFDLTPRLTAVKNQGGCGACWAFAITAAVENFPVVQFGLATLSEQNMIDCDAQSSGCEGGDFDGFDFAEQSGLASESDYAFTGSDGQCSHASPAIAKVIAWNFVANSENDEPSDDQIKTALYQSSAPVTVAIHAGMALEAYSGGIIDSCGYWGGLNHMVNIVGWDDTDQDWIVRNSWGGDWGEQGNFRILRENSNGAKCQGIGEEAAFITNATFLNH
jgi:C1A family cysteine protease